MAKRILVPLDHSTDSEAVLPVVADIARSAGSTIRLLNVQSVPSPVVADFGRVVAYEDQEMARLRAQGEIYLEAAEASLHGMPVESVVRFGEPAEEIAVEADAWDADLVAMAASGPRPGRLGRLRGRRVADEVLQRTTVPVLVYRVPTPGRRFRGSAR